MARHEMPANRLHPGPIPMDANIGFAADGSTHAKSERRTVLPAMALAA